MLETTVKYKNFKGEEREQTLTFYITETQIIRMMLNESEIDMDGVDVESGEAPEVTKYRQGLSDRIEQVMSRGKGKEILELFDWLMENAYGVISDDGERFEQGPELFAEFKKTAVYAEFWRGLVYDTDRMTEFVNGIFPESVRKAMEENKEDPEFKSHREALKKATKKS